MKKNDGCPWCGAGTSGDVRKCPRGKACAADQANHDSLMGRIRDLDKRKGK